MVFNQQLIFSLMFLTVGADLQDQSLMIQTGYLQTDNTTQLEALSLGVRTQGTCSQYCQSKDAGTGKIVSAAPICNGDCPRHCPKKQCTDASQMDGGGGCAMGVKICCCSRASGPCSTPSSEDQDWDDLKRHEREGASALGWTKNSWDCEGKNCQKPASEDKAWIDLSTAERKGAGQCGWDQQSWDCGRLPSGRAWKLALNLNPSDGNRMGYGSSYWAGNTGLGSPATALTEDFVDETVYKQIANYIAIARHPIGSSTCEAVKVWKFTSEGKTLHYYMNEPPRTGTVSPRTKGGAIDEYNPSNLANKDKDPIFGNTGDLQINYYYSNNGCRMVLTGAFGYPTKDNTDDIHGLGNELGADCKNLRDSNNWWHDVAQRYDKDCHGSSCPVMGTDRGTSLSRSSISYQYAIYISQEATSFPCKGTRLVSPWVMGKAGTTCDATCSAMGNTCDVLELNKLTTNELLGAAFNQAGYKCKGFHAARSYAGTPFSTGRSDDCAPVEKGKKVTCSSNQNSKHSPLCFCKNANKVA